MNQVTLPQTMARTGIMLEAQYGLLKKALKAEAAAVAQILESLPEASPAPNPDSPVGNQVNFYA